MTDLPQNDDMPTLSHEGGGSAGELPTVSNSDSHVQADESRPQIEGYEILDLLGRGGMGSVWRAVQLGTKNKVAIKILPGGQFRSPELRVRFEREVELSARLVHPNIVRVYDSGLHHGVYYYAMELIEGLPLDQYVEQNKLSQGQILSLMRTVAQAVQHAHQRGVIHRDIKPSNILVTADGQPHVLDFGLAKAFIEGEVGLTISQDGEVAGTPAFMSPEQAAGKTDEIDTRSDVYSLGVMLYRLLTGKSPHDLTGTRYEVLRRIAEDEVRRPSEVVKRIDRELESLLLKALAQSPQDRYAAATDLADDLGNYLAGDPLTAERPTVFYFLRKRIRKHRLAVSLTAIIVAVLICVAIAAYAQVTVERNRALTAEAASVNEAKRADKEAGIAKAAEEEAKNQAEKVKAEAEQLRRSKYRSQILLADSYTSQNDTSAALDALGDTPADLRGWEWGRLLLMTDLSYMTLRGHGPRIQSVAFSPDGRRIASGSNFSTIVVWEADSGKKVLTFRGHDATFRGYKDGITSIAFSPDGQRIASGSYDKTIKLWEINSGQEILTLRGHENTITSVVFSPDGQRIASGSSDKTIKLWEINSGQEILTLRGHEKEISSVAFNPEGRRIASGSLDTTIKLWDVKSGQEISTLRGHKAPIESVAFSPDGRLIASGSWDKTIKLWDANRGQAISTLRGHKDVISSVAFSPDGQRIASGSYDKTIKIWDMDIAQDVLTLYGHENIVNSFAFSPDGRRIASGSDDGTIKVWGANSDNQGWTLRTDGVKTISFSPDGRRIVAECWKEILFLEADSGKEVLTLRGGRSLVAFSPDGRRVASGGDDKTIRLWDVNSGEEILTLRGHEERIVSVAFSPDGRRIASGSHDSTIKVWETDSGSNFLTLRGHKGVISSIAFSPDGRRILSGSDDKTVKLWDVNSGQEILTFRGHTAPIKSVAFSPDGQRIASGSDDKTVKLWNVNSGQEILTFRGHTAPIKSVAFSPDGRRIAAESRKEIIFVEADSGKEVLTFYGISLVAFSPDCRRTASGRVDTIRLLDANSREEILGLRGHEGDISSVAFSPDGRRIASGNNKTIKVWNSVGWDKIDDLKTIYAMSSLAISLDKHKNHREAEKLLRAILCACQGIQGRDHPYTQYMLKVLSNCLKAQGKTGEAESLQNELATRPVSTSRASVPTSQP